MKVLKHICIRHDGMLTIIPDATGIRVESGVIGRHGDVYTLVGILRATEQIEAFKNPDEISSPYSQTRQEQ